MAPDVALAGAELALLTKIDDQVIDDPAFHGGRAADRGELRSRTIAYLAPTLESVRTGTPATEEPRCELAADLGRRLRLLTDERARLEWLLEVLERGWAIQVDAVATFTAHPRHVSAAEVDRVSADISGAWLMMIAAVGALPGDAERSLTRGEERLFFEWGLPIQRADALSDLARDLGDGLVTTACGHALWHRGVDVCAMAGPEGPRERAYEALVEHDLDTPLLPSPRSLGELEAGLGSLGRLPALLRWIHGFLLVRYLGHPLCCRRPSSPPFTALVGDVAAFSSYHAGLTAAGATPYPGLDGETD